MAEVKRPEMELPELDEKGWTGNKCPSCKGSGEGDYERRTSCPSCAGTGDEYSNEHCRKTQLLEALQKVASLERRLSTYRSVVEKVRSVYPITIEYWLQLEGEIDSEKEDV